MYGQSLHQTLQLSASQTNARALIKAAVRRLLASMGMEVLMTRTLNAYLNRYRDTCSEIESVYREVVFQDLPERDGRVRLMVGLQGTGPSEAMWILGHLHRSLSLPGDVCEFGVAQGATSALLANEIQDTSKLLW